MYFLVRIVCISTLALFVVSTYDEKNSENIETRSFIKKPELVYGVSNGIWGIWKPWLEMRQEILRNIDQKLNSMMLLFIPNKPVQIAGPDLHKGQAVQLITSAEKPIELPWPVSPPYQAQFWVKPVLLDRYTTASVIYRPNIAGLGNTPTLPTSLVNHPISVPIPYNPLGSYEDRPLIYINPKEKNDFNNSETNFWKPQEIRPLKPQIEESLGKVDKTENGINLPPIGPAYIPVYLGVPSNGAPLSPNHGPILENYGGNTIVHVGLPDSNIQITKGNQSLTAGTQGSNPITQSSNKPNLSISGLENYPGVIILKPNCTLDSTDCIGGNNNNNNVKNETYTEDNTNYYGGNSGYPNNQGRPGSHSQNEYIVPTIADIDYHETGANENGYNPRPYGNIVATSSSSSAAIGSGGMKEPEMTTKSDIENISGLEILSANNSSPRLPLILEYIRKNT